MEKTYEQAVRELEKIVERLEGSDVSLEESIELFEEGIKLADICNQKLNTAERKFTKLADVANTQE